MESSTQLNECVIHKSECFFKWLQVLLLTVCNAASSRMTPELRGLRETGWRTGGMSPTWPANQGRATHCAPRAWASASALLSKEGHMYFHTSSLLIVSSPKHWLKLAESVGMLALPLDVRRTFLGFITLHYKQSQPCGQCASVELIEVVIPFRPGEPKTGTLSVKKATRSMGAFK